MRETTEGYPARECPELISPEGFTAGRHRCKWDFKDYRPANNPFVGGSDEWRGYEFGVYLYADE